MKTKIISITTNLSRYGGAQKVLMDVHNGLSKKFECIITGRQDFDSLHPKYKIRKEEYIKFSPSLLRNNIIIVHARNIIPIIVLLNKVLFLNAKIIYVSHNVYNTYANFTFFPKNIVSISNKVTQNLLEYFKVKNKNITLIYNGIHDNFKQNNSIREYKKDGIIKILYPARVNKVKRQVEIVRSLKGKLDANIQIFFAGVGEEYELLQKECEQTDNFVALGFVQDMESTILNYDYLMLYSFQEGLPIALLEGIMSGKPLLINDVGGNLEIGEIGRNGYLLDNDIDKLHEEINKINTITKEEYNKFSINSRKLFEEKFQYQTMIDNYTELINKIT